ncbi:MAG TPA: NAD(P)H-binding protein, partial [Fibrella sp.]
MTIAIIGATGMLGQPVAQELMATGFTVRIVARNIDEAKRLFPAAEVVFGDLQKPESLPAALAGCEATYLSLSVKQAEKPTGFHTETDGL